MTHFSLAHLTVLSVPPPEVIRIAARTGYQTVGLRLIRVTDTTPGYPLMDDPAMLRDTLTVMRDTGVGVLDIEFVQIRPETDIQALVAIRPERLPFLHLCDAPVAPSWTTEELLHAARAERLAPGDGSINLPLLIATMPRGIPLALEVPMIALTAEIGSEGAPRHLRSAAERVNAGLRY